MTLKQKARELAQAHRDAVALLDRARQAVRQAEIRLLQIEAQVALVTELTAPKASHGDQ
jgi:hypothetical protein